MSFSTGKFPRNKIAAAKIMIEIANKLVSIRNGSMKTQERKSVKSQGLNRAWMRRIN
jgi:hypothetical protein